MKKSILILLSAVLCTFTLYADKPEHAAKAKKIKHQEKREHKKVKQHFSSHEKEKIYAYYSALPPGLAKKLKRGGQLPQGWQNKVNAGEVMPAEYLQYAKPVSSELQTQLSSGPIGSQLLQIADRVVRIEAGTNIILDAIRF